MTRPTAPADAPRPDLHLLTSFTAELPGGGHVIGRHPDPQYPHHQTRWVVDIRAAGSGCWSEVKARLEDVTSAEDLWARILALKAACRGEAGAGDGS